MIRHVITVGHITYIEVWLGDSETTRQVSHILCHGHVFECVDRLWVENNDQRAHLQLTIDDSISCSHQ